MGGFVLGFQYDGKSMREQNMPKQITMWENELRSVEYVVEMEAWGLGRWSAL
jgi:hypothetical protein